MNTGSYLLTTQNPPDCHLPHKVTDVHEGKQSFHYLCANRKKHAIMIDCKETEIFGRHFFKVIRLYHSAFPKIERHPVMELFRASGKGMAEFLRFTDGGRFIGLAYMIVRGKVAFLLYLAVDKDKRNRGYGSAILQAIRNRYPDKDIVLLIESLHEECDNMDIRVRRKKFYLRNGLRDTGLIQNSCGGEANYDILNTREEFSTDAYSYLLAHYPFKTYLEDIRKA